VSLPTDHVLRHKTRPLNKSRIEAYLAERVRELHRKLALAQPIIAARYREALYRPEKEPEIDQILLADSGEIWVRLMADSAASTWRVYDPQLKRTGIVTMSLSELAMGVSPDGIWSFMTSDAGLISQIVFRPKPPLH